MLPKQTIVLNFNINYLELERLEIMALLIVAITRRVIEPWVVDWASQACL